MHYLFKQVGLLRQAHIKVKIYKSFVDVFLVGDIIHQEPSLKYSGSLLQIIPIL